MKTIKQILSILLCLLVFACGKDEENDIDSGSGNISPIGINVPINITGKDLHFGTTSDNLFFSLLQTDSEVKVVMKDGWNVSNAICEYEKLDDLNAKLNVNFDLDLGLDNPLKHYYAMNLNFSSNTGGIFSSIHRLEYNGKETEVKDNGVFGYNIGETEIFDKEPEKTDVDFKQLYHSWIYQKSDTTYYITFEKENMSYLLVSKADDFYKEEKGSIRIVPGAYLLSLMPEETETRKHYRVQILNDTKLTWISYLAATGASIDSETFLPSDTNGVEASNLTEDIISMKLSTITPDYFGIKFHWKAGTYDIEGDKLNIGVCYSTLPHPQITDEISDFSVAIPIGEENENGSTEFLIKDLKPATIYYARPFTIIDGEPIYFEELSVETVGNHIQAKLEKESYLKMKVSYKINQPGTYRLRIEHFSPYYGMIYREDFGYKEQGDSDEFSYTCIYSMGSTHTFRLVMFDMNNNIVYKSNSITYEE